MRAALRRPALARVHRRLWHDVWTPGRLGGATADASRPQLLRWHFVALHERPALSAVGGAAGAAFLGDLGAQAFEAAASVPPAPGAPAAAPRAVGFAAIVGAIVGGVGHAWHRRFLVPTFPGRTYESGLRALVDLTLFAPAAFAAVVAGVSLLETSDAARTRAKLAAELQAQAHHMGRLWFVWGAGQALSNFLAPVALQPAVALALATVWSGYASFVVHQPAQTRALEARLPTAEERGEYLRESRKWD